jgi:hypothetical protein
VVNGLIQGHKLQIMAGGCELVLPDQYSLAKVVPDWQINNEYQLGTVSI